MGTDVVSPPLERGPGAGTVRLTVNGDTHELELEPRVSLLDALREHLGLTGSKKGCDQGTCGACTVWVDGRRVLGCLTLAVTCEGREVTTIEGLAAEGQLQRWGSLIDSQLVREVSSVLYAPEKDVREIAALVTDPNEVEVFATGLENQPGFDLLWRVYLAPALIQGVFHEQVARQENWQAWRHPLRRHVLALSSGQEPHRIPQFDTFLANIILAGALSHRYGRHDAVMERRIKSWIGNVQQCRGKNIRRPPEDASVDQALSAAVSEARRLGVTVTPKYLDKAISVTSGLALGVIGVLFGHFVSPEAGDIAGIALGGGGYLIDPGSLLIGPERRLREYAQFGPGRADAVA